VALWLATGAARADSLSLRDAAAAAGVRAEDSDWTFEAQTTEPAPPISTTRAVLYSLLLPGLGDYQLGNRGRAAAFFAVEGAIWISYAAFEVQGGTREDEYESLAVRFAGVTRTGHSDEFYAELREYDSSAEYEADIKMEGRSELVEEIDDLDRIGSDALEAYFTDHRVTDYEPWQWVSLDRRLQYSEVRSSSKTSYRRADYMIAAAAANRLVSAVFAYAGARSAQKAYRASGVGVDIDFWPRARGVDVAMVLTRSF
jgi:hypothetical protein